MTSPAYESYKTLSDNLEQVEQSLADDAMRRYIDLYKDDVEIATIAYMPHTTLTKSEAQRITEIINIKTDSETLWQRYLAGDLTLTIAERNVI